MLRSHIQNATVGARVFFTVLATTLMVSGVADS